MGSSIRDFAPARAFKKGIPTGEFRRAFTLNTLLIFVLTFRLAKAFREVTTAHKNKCGQGI